MNSQERDDYVVTLLEAQRPLRAIYKLAGMTADFGYDVCRSLIAKHNIQYQPVETGEPTLLDEATRRLRGRLADKLYTLGGTPTSIAIKTGIPPRSQKKALNAPFDYDWKLSEITRLAANLDITVEELLNVK